jgi:hypothetical protein
MKVLVAELLSLQEGSFAASLLSELPGLDERGLRSRLARLENGDDYSSYGIHNFLEGDYFGWYLEPWNSQLSEAVTQLLRALAEFEPTTPTLRPGEMRDLLKRLYQYLVPRRLRHDLGEYYTPDWLADRLLNQLGYDGDPDKRLLDPACGSGTFLTLALGRVRERMQFEMWDREPGVRRQCALKVLRNIVGYDLNPLAVIAARTNYLLAFGDLLRDIRPVEIPVYNCDSILTPVLQRRQQQAQLALDTTAAQSVDYFYLPTVVGEFRIPRTVLEQQALGPVTALIEECLKLGYQPPEFLSRLRKHMVLDAAAGELLRTLYEKFIDLDRRGKNGIWARLLKNSFAPVLQKPFDLIAGNPPWVNWESLPKSWREASKELWAHYGLFSLKGHAARLGGGKKDIAMLFTYVCADHYLKPKGQIGFVITQTVFKTKGAGDGFRRFQLGENGPQLRVKTVDDLSDLQPFEGASNRTAILTLVKGEPTRYPVSYTLWERNRGQRIALESTLEQARVRSSRRSFFAEPVDRERATSPWITADRYVLSALRKVVGPSDYRAYAGSCTWLNGVYWVRIVEQRPDGLLMVENLGTVGKNTVPVIRAPVEPDLLYPLLRGQDIRLWHAAPSTWILLAQDPERRTGWSEATMKANWPNTYRYFKQFEALLCQRSGYRQYFRPGKDPFWSIYNVGAYTLAPYKVVWRQMIPTPHAAVVSSLWDDDLGQRVVIPQHTVTLVPSKDPDEAFYICALMNSAIAGLISKSYSTSKSYGTPSVVQYVSLPAFDRGNATHLELAQIGLQAHSHPDSADAIVATLNRLAAALWGLDERELRAVVRELGDRRVKP